MTAAVLVVAEHREGTLRDVTFEAVDTAVEQAGDGGTVHVSVIAESPDDLVDDLDLAAVDEIHTFAHPGLFNHDIYVQVISQLVDALSPDLVIAGHTAMGMDYVPAVAERLDSPLITDVVALTGEDDGLVATRERFGSKVEATIRVDVTPAVVTIRPGTWTPSTTPGSPSVTRLEAAIDSDAVRASVTSLETAPEGEIDIADADIIVSVGRGIGEAENLDLIEELAEALGATLAASRPIVDAGWLPKNRQVGQSGKSVSPTIYIAIGISGAVQHVAGMRGAETVIAINDDPNAPIFEVADVGIVDDLFEVVPALIEEFAEG